MKLASFNGLLGSGLMSLLLVFSVSCGGSDSNQPSDTGKKAPCRYVPIKPAKTPEPEIPSPKTALAALARAMAAMDLVAIEACYTPERWKLERSTREKDMARMKEMGVTNMVLTYEDSDLKEHNDGEFVSVWAKLKFETKFGALTRESGEAWIEEEHFIMRKLNGVWKFTK